MEQDKRDKIKKCGTKGQEEGYIHRESTLVYSFFIDKFGI